MTRSINQKLLTKLITKRLKSPQSHNNFCPVCEEWCRSLIKHHIHKNPSISIRICRRCEKAIHKMESSIEKRILAKGTRSANDIYKNLGFKEDDINKELLQEPPNRNKYITSLMIRPE